MTETERLTMVTRPKDVGTGASFVIHGVDGRNPVAQRVDSFRYSGAESRILFSPDLDDRRSLPRDSWSQLREYSGDRLYSSPPQIGWERGLSAERVDSLGARNLEGNHDVSSNLLFSSDLTGYGAMGLGIGMRNGVQSSDRFGRWDAAPDEHPDDSDYEDRQYGRRHHRMQGGSSDRDDRRERLRDTSRDSLTRREIRSSRDSENCMPADSVISQQPLDGTCHDSVDDYISELCDRVYKSHELVRKNISDAAAFRQKRYDVSVKSNDLSVGTWVWYSCPRRRVSLSRKWQSYYTGPYLVVEMIDFHCIGIQRSRESKVLVVHRDKLKKCFSETPNSWLESQSTGKQSQPAIAPSSPSTVGDPQHANDAGDAPSPAPQRFSRRGRQRQPDGDPSTVEPTTQRPRQTTKPSYLNDSMCSVSIDGLVPDQKSSMAENQLSNALTCRACKQTFQRKFCLHRHLRTASLAEKHRRFYGDQFNAEQLYAGTSLRWYDIRKESLIGRSRNPSGVLAVAHYDEPVKIVRQFHGADGRNRLEAAVHAVLTDTQSVNLQQAIESFQFADLGLTAHEAEVAAIAAFAAAQVAADTAIDAGQLRKLDRLSLCLNKRLHHLDGLLYRWRQGCPDANVVQGTRDYTVNREIATWCTAYGQSNTEQPDYSGKAAGRRRRRQRQRMRRCNTATCGRGEADSEVVVIPAPGE
jgi:hypothetical protein